MVHTFSAKEKVFLNAAVVVSALGYFVDIFDILLFSIVRKQSLADIGILAENALADGEFLLAVQMIGLITGGIIFGIIGDRKGRLSVLFASILTYSIANILNGFITTYEEYVVLRFIAGIGLAGELGAGITLVSELLPKEKRGLSAAFIGAFGFLGAIFAFLVTQYFSWRTCYFIGGGMGLLLLIGRVNVHESMMFKRLGTKVVSKGNVLLFFKNRDRGLRYLKCVLTGLPSWFVVGILVTFADQFADQFGIKNVTAGKAVLYTYTGLIAGDISSALISKMLQSRKKAILLFYLITIFGLFLFFYFKGGGSAINMYLLYAFLGFGIGFSIINVTMAAEQFGTNLRATAAISMPNMVRGSLPLTLFLFSRLRIYFGDYITGAWVTGVIVIAAGCWAISSIRDSYNNELDFVEE